MRANFFNKKMLRNVDWVLLGIVFALLLLGVVAITSATSTAYSEEDLTFWEFVETLDFSYAELQFAFFALGLIAVAVVLLVDYNNLRDFSDILYWISVALLVAVKLFGSEQNGISGWFVIFGRGFQPAEFCKIIMIIVLAKEFAQRTEGRAGGLSTMREMWPILWRFAIPFALILWQSDYGSAIVYAFVLLGILFMAKTSWKVIGILVAGATVLIPASWFIMAPYQKNRILTFLDPKLDPEGAGMHVLRSKAVASAGGMNGKGFFSEELLTQQSSYLPNAHTDFIFSATSEAIGFVGGLLIIGLYLLLLLRLVQLATRAKDDFGAYLVIGVASMLLFHIFENIGMNIGLMPVTGIPLPLFTYGGSNVLTTMIAIGLVLNVNMRRVRYGV